MKSACIIIPHIDDEIYSCWSILSDKSYDEILIVRCTSGKSQLIRKDLQEKFVIDPDKYGLNINIKIKDIFGDIFDSPADGSLYEVDKRKFITAIDKLIRNGFTELYIPSPSHHQDHESLYHHCIASITRDEGRVDSVYAYTYMYNHNDSSAIAYKLMTTEALENKLKCLDDLNEVANIYTCRRSSRKYIQNMNETFGMECGAAAAEIFIPIKITI